MIKIKECPFCTDGGELEVHATRICEEWYTASVLCNQCGVQMIRGGDNEQEAKDYVIQAWNTRAEHTCTPTAKPNAFEFSNCYRECGNELLEVEKVLDERLLNYCKNCGAKIIE